MGEHADHDGQRRFSSPSPTARPDRRIGVTAHVVIPACLSGLLLLVFFPLILRLQPAAYEGATGRSPDRYLIVWLLFTAALFLASALIWAVRMARRR